MNRLVLILFISIQFFACNSELKTEKPKSERISLETTRKIEVDTTEKITHPNKKISGNTKKCECKLSEYERNFYANVIFQSPKHYEIKNDSLYKKWSHKSKVDEVKSIRFSGFDSIPKKFSVFQNVEKVIISSRNGISGLDIFPNLKTVHFWGSEINLDTKEKWKRKIQILIAEKTKLIGISSFSEMPNLKVMHMGFSGFDYFPSDLDKLNCLNELTFGAYMFGEINLNELDLSKNKCLKKVMFMPWQNTLNGIPKGLFESNIRELKIEHQMLTELEKSKLKQVKASW